MIELAIKLALGMLLDRLCGEPRATLHPLVAFGRWAGSVEAHVRRHADGRIAGLLAWLICILPLALLALWLRELAPWAHWPVDIALLYLALGARSLEEHAKAVAIPLSAGDLPQARTKLARIVSRDTDTLDATGVAGATTESVLENGNDAVFATLFWFSLLGGVGALLFRLANTLDAMWGYRSAQYLRFGCAAARIDDAMGWIPARFTALTYALLGHTRSALACWHTQAPTWKSPNAGPVMAAGAGALRVRLGGPAHYHGREESRPALGGGEAPDALSISRACALVRTGMLLWLGIAVLSALLVEATW